MQAKKKKLKQFQNRQGAKGSNVRSPKTQVVEDKNEPPAKRPRTSIKSDAQELIIKFMIERVERANLPEEIKDALDVLKNCENEPKLAKPRPSKLSKVINPDENSHIDIVPVKKPLLKTHNFSTVINPVENSHIDIKPVEKQDNCSGTEHMENDYIESEIQKHEDKKKKMRSKGNQTDKEGSQRNKEVTDRVFSDDFKCRSYTGMFLISFFIPSCFILLFGPV